MPNIRGMQGVPARLVKLYPKADFKRIISERCKFCDGGFCEKQLMRCMYINKQCMCGYFAPTNKLTFAELIKIPEEWFVKKYLEEIYNRRKELGNPNILGTYIDNVFQENKRFDDRDIAEIWVCALLEFVENAPQNVIESKIRKFTPAPKEIKKIAGIKNKPKEDKKCKNCGNKTIGMQDYCANCRQMGYGAKDKNSNVSKASNIMNNENARNIDQLSPSQYEIFMQCKSTAGCWFIVNYLKDVQKHYNELQDMDYKKNYAKNIFLETRRDCKVKNTLTRVNCMIRLVKYGLVDYAYNYAINSRWELY